AQQKLFTDITDEEWDDMIGIHLSGTFRCCRAVLPEMIRRREGSIINVSSMWGQIGGSCEVHYSAAKAGIIGLTKALAKEVGVLAQLGKLSFAQVAYGYGAVCSHGSF
ncbi:MAG: SDR family NAD(P)-dependent oxidoreductase, partial [Akkermansia sp.]|nr:SDR family NAD(P)-dependent oxidoreductase [Akkermansia sp.]